MSAVLAPGRARRRDRHGLPLDSGAQDALFAPEAALVAAEAPPTLDDVISHGWEGVRAGVAMDCPICEGELAPDAGGARCERCGSTLA